MMLDHLIDPDNERPDADVLEDEKYTEAERKTDYEADNADS